MNIEFKEIDLKHLSEYDVSSYPSKGFYLVETEITVGKSMVYNDGIAVLWMTVLPEDYTSIKEVSNETNNEDTNMNNSITQELFLKTLSLVINKDESYK